MMTQRELIEALKPYIEEPGLMAIMIALQMICDQRADNAAIALQNMPLAKAWTMAGKAIHHSIEVIENLEVLPL